MAMLEKVAHTKAKQSVSVKKLIYSSRYMIRIFLSFRPMKVQRSTSLEHKIFYDV